MRVRGYSHPDGDHFALDSPRLKDDIRAFAAGIWADASDVMLGTSHHTKRECPGCGRSVRSLEHDGYCCTCAEAGW